LYEFEKNNPQMEPLVKTLLRAYAGIFENAVPVSEMMLANLTKKNKEDLIEELKQLHNYRVISYQPQKDSPQLFFLRSRTKAEDLSIDLKAFQNRKEKFIERNKNMVRYIKEKVECRSKIIGGYFGDNDLENCAVCDNCLNQKTFQVSKEEFEEINHRITDSIKQKPIHSKELIEKLGGIKKEKAWKVLDFLQAENKIELDKAGFVRLK